MPQHKSYAILAFKGVYLKTPPAKYDLAPCVKLKNFSTSASLNVKSRAA
jgi:hypothetical protein